MMSAGHISIWSNKFVFDVAKFARKSDISMSLSNVTFLIRIMQLCRRMLLQICAVRCLCKLSDSSSDGNVAVASHLSDCSCKGLAIATCEMWHVSFRGCSLLLAKFCLRGLRLLLKIPIVWDIKRCCATYSKSCLIKDLSVARWYMLTGK